MTVAELIEHLSKLPQEARVCVAYEGVYSPAEEVEYSPPEEASKWFPTGVVFISDREGE